MSLEKRFLLGTHRVRDPEETWKDLRPLLPRIGITRVADVTALDGLGIPVFQAVRPESHTLSVSQGKGATPAAARVSAAMESLELWHAEDLSHLPRIEMSLREMRYDNAIPLTALRWASRAPAADAVPISWVRARSLSGDRRGWLPRSMVELDFRLQERIVPRFFNVTSNGLASGNCREEALLHGICELVERHAVYLARREPSRRVPLRLDDLSSPWCREPVERIRAAGLKIAAWDLTWEAGIPCCEVVLASPDLPMLWQGAGCHPSPEVAFSRAVTEAAQSRLTFISGARDDVNERPVGTDPFPGFAETTGPRSLSELPDLTTSSVAADLEGLVLRLESSGLEVFYLDLTRPEIGVPVTLAFIPGLREVAHA